MLLRSSLWKAALLQEHLQHISALSTLPAACLSLLMGKLSVASHAAGSVLFQEGQPVNRLYLVLQGRVALVQALGTVDERVLHVCGAGEFIDGTTVYGAERIYSASACVQQDAQLLALSRTDFEMLLTHAPQLAELMHWALHD